MRVKDAKQGVSPLSHHLILRRIHARAPHWRLSKHVSPIIIRNNQLSYLCGAVSPWPIVNSMNGVGLQNQAFCSSAAFVPPGSLSFSIGDCAPDIGHIEDRDIYCKITVNDFALRLHRHLSRV